MSLFPDVLRQSEELVGFMIDIRDGLQRSAALKSRNYSFDFYAETPLKTLGQTPLFQWMDYEDSDTSESDGKLSDVCKSNGISSHSSESSGKLLDASENSGMSSDSCESSKRVSDVSGRFSNVSRSTSDSAGKVMATEMEDNPRYRYSVFPAAPMDIAEEEELEEDLDEGEVTPLPTSNKSILRKPSY